MVMAVWDVNTISKQMIVARINFEEILFSSEQYLANSLLLLLFFFLFHGAHASTINIMFLYHWHVLVPEPVDPLVHRLHLLKRLMVVYGIHQ